ncbi:hypothetical protein J0A67_10260 [Algoriphagus aestuariicola]|uniref:Peptide O-xylosyltransferase n=1 Tax=Algoriphagus aestuariicola TaxID=1852016 RepID=A0ABS3BQD6_9BACT|nr:beta-1,6-N-acetylglucosaminyltransferase [Algoriphagus aestuariicola]MBN7801247.1 hypothetical protein [Algoriphagus aestuariicola]
MTNLENLPKRVNALQKLPNIAYLILVHRFPEQFKRLFRAIYQPENHYLIHVDKKADPKTNLIVESFLMDYPNTYVMDRENVGWGGFSMVQSELNGMLYLLTHNLKWDFFINLSGQDFPLHSQRSIRGFLGKHPRTNFIKADNQAQERPETMNRIDNHFTETHNGFEGFIYRRPYMQGITSYIGGQWMIVTRACCEFLCFSPEVKKFEDFYLNTLLADESFFQTVLMNTSFEEAIVSDDKRAIIWVSDGEIKLRPKTFTIDDLEFLASSDDLFARKFDEGLDDSILRALEGFLESDFSSISSAAAAQPLPTRTFKISKTGGLTTRTLLATPFDDG